MSSPRLPIAFFLYNLSIAVFKHHVFLPVISRELGRQYREEMEKKRKLEMEGHTVFLEYSHKGTEAKKLKEVPE